MVTSRYEKRVQYTFLYKYEYSSCTKKDKYCERTTKIRTLSVKIGRKIHVLLERSWKVQMWAEYGNLQMAQQR